MCSDCKVCKIAPKANSRSRGVCQIVPKANSKSLYVLQILVDMVFQIVFMCADYTGDFKNKDREKSLRKDTVYIYFFL